jgi:hypothetical protein
LKKWGNNSVTPGKETENVVDALSRLGIDRLKIQKEESLTLASGSENSSIRISNF